jgi:hypothetical protein
MGTSSSPLCTTPSDFRWGLIFDQTASYGTPRWLRGSPQAPKGGVSPIPRIIACGVWGVGPLSLVLQWSCLPVVWGFVSCFFCLYGLFFFFFFFFNQQFITRCSNAVRGPIIQTVRTLRLRYALPVITQPSASGPPSGGQTQAEAHEYSITTSPFRVVKKSRPPHLGLHTQ